MLKEYLHRRPQADFSWSFMADSEKGDAAAKIATLKREGIVMLPGYFQGEKLSALQAAFARAIEDKESEINPDSLLNLDFIPSNPAFLKSAIDAYLMEIIAGYYQKPFAIGRSSAMRIQPTEPLRDNSFQWHHDSRGRQIHMMIILNDLPTDGQRMSYLNRTHERYYTHYRGLAEGSRFEKDLAANPPGPDQITEVCGPAGTVSIFDANGLHTGNRNSNGKRDTVTFCYVSRRHWKPINYRREEVEQLKDPFRHVVTFNPYHKLV